MTLKYIQTPHITYHNDSITIESKSWYYNGGLHYDDGPADTQYRKDGTIWRESWHQCGKMHRLDGPALIFTNEYIKGKYSTTWWAYGIQYKFTKWLNYCDWDDATKVEMKLKYG